MNKELLDCFYKSIENPELVKKLKILVDYLVRSYKQTTEEFDFFILYADVEVAVYDGPDIIDYQLKENGDVRIIWSDEKFNVVDIKNTTLTELCS